MKKKNYITAFVSLALVLNLFVLGTSPARSQNPQYLQAMRTEIANIQKIDSLPKLTATANAFGRIAAMNKTEWLPLYYQALAHTYKGLNTKQTPERRDQDLDIATDLAKKADALSPNNSEIVALQGFVVMTQLVVNPAERGQTHSAAVMNFYGKALQLNAKNPRALALLAQMELGMSQFFNTGPEKACELAKQSLSIFDEESQKATGEYILPTWGKSMSENLIKNSCK